MAVRIFYLWLFIILFSNIILGINTRGITHFYLPHIIMNLIFFSILYFKKKTIISYLEKLIEWVNQDDFRYARRIVFGFLILMMVSYHMRLHLGIWLSGVAGWEYSKLSTLVSDTPFMPMESNANSEELQALHLNIIDEHLQYLDSEGYLFSQAMLLHYEGSILPANYAITEIVFAQYVVGNLYVEFRDEELFLDIVHLTMPHRQQNRRFILPLNIAYPNHAPYMNIDYSTYPPIEELDRVTLWRYMTYLSGEGTYEIVGTQLMDEIVVDQVNE